MRCSRGDIASHAQARVASLPGAVEDTEPSGTWYRPADVASTDEGRPVTSLSDADMALALQLAEVESSRMRVDLQEAPAQVGRVTDIAERILIDPVWGEVRFVGNGPSRCQVATFACCPCWIVGCGCGGQSSPVEERRLVGKADARRAWNRFVFSFATLCSALQCLVFVFVIIYGRGFAPTHINPMLGPHVYVLNDMGAKNAARVLQYGEWWRLISPIALHSGVIHLLANIIVQLRLGVLLEILWGHRLWLQIYIASGIYASLASCCFLPDVLSVGSSGGICGLISAAIVFYLLTWRQTLPRDVVERNVQLASLSCTVLITLAMSLLPLMDLAAHAGGFLAGGLLGAALFAERLQDSAGLRKATQVTGAAIFFILAVVTGAYLVLVVRPNPALLHLCSPHECS